MIGDTVAIEIPGTVSELDEGRAIGACEAALGDESCSRLEQGVAADFTARVTATSASELTIELVLSGQEEVETVRVLKFSEDEPEAFRWQSVGVVIAALVLSRSPREAPALPEPPLPEPEQRARPKAAAEDSEQAPDDSDAPDQREDAREPGVATVDLGPLIASTASGAGVAGGAWLGAALRWKGPLHVVASGEASFSSAETDAAAVQARSLGASLGLGLRSPFWGSAFGGEVSFRSALQSLSVRAESSSESGSAATLRWGGRAGLGIYWFPSRFLGLVAGGDAGLLWPPIDVEAGSAEPIRVGALIWGGYLGLRIRVNRF